MITVWSISVYLRYSNFDVVGEVVRVKLTTHKTGVNLTGSGLVWGFVDNPATLRSASGDSIEFHADSLSLSALSACLRALS